MTYRGIVSNGVVVIDGLRPNDGTIVEVTPLQEPGVQSPNPLDITSRLNEFRNLQDGWLDGQGKSPTSEGLDWLASAFARRFSEELPTPHLYPTPAGGIQAEWSLNTWEISLEIDLERHAAEWHGMDMKAGRDEIKMLDLNSDEAWVWLATEIKTISMRRA